MAKQREAGFYWVKYNGQWHTAEWQVDQCSYYCVWLVLGDDSGYEDGEFDEIGCKIECPYS